MKPLSALARAELEIEAKFAGKLWAYTAVIGKHEPARLGIAVANEPGYVPIPEYWANGSYDEMSDHADALNAERGQSLDESLRIVAASMAAGKVGA